MAYDDNEVYDGFDVTIGKEADAGGFVVLPDGEYPFTVATMEKEFFNGSESIPACHCAVVTLSVDGGPLGRGSVKHRLYMAKKQAWKIKQLFVGLGLVAADAEEFTPPWPQMFGASGYVKLTSHEYNGRTYNDVDRILDPQAAAEAAARSLGAAPSAPAPAQAPWG